MSSITANSRMIYAFSRDGAMPFSNFWHHVNPKRRVPVRSAWFGAIFAFILGSPYLFNTVAYGAVTSIAVIGLYIAYLVAGVPAAHQRQGVRAGSVRARATPGALITSWIAIVWVCIICILFMLPTYAAGGASRASTTRPSPCSSSIGGAGLWYAVSARKWFHGPEDPGYRRRARRDRARPQQFDELSTLASSTRSGTGRAARPAPSSSVAAASPPSPAAKARQPGASELRCALWQLERICAVE